MMRKCPKCNEVSVKVRMLSFSNRMHCEKCFYQYEYTSLTKNLVTFAGALIPILAVILGLYVKSWIVFGVILVISPFAGDILFAKYCALKPVGVRALRAKIRGENL